MFVELKKIHLPGSVWFAILVLATALIHAYLPNPAYYDVAIVLLGALAKAVGVNYDKVIAVVDTAADEPVPPAQLARSGMIDVDVVGGIDEGAGSKLTRWLVG